MATNKKKTNRNSKSFWETLPGLITAIAAFITAIGGCLAIILSNQEAISRFLSKTPTSSPSPLASASTLSTGGTRISSKDGMVMVYVPAGKFQMGSENGYADERPVHTVYLDSFWIDQTEVTNKMYAQCVDIAGTCLPPSPNESTSNYFLNPKFADYPVIYVSWEEASSYCSWVGRYLPTEAQWEKAARGFDNRAFPWGNEAPNNSLLNFNNVLGSPSQVGSYPRGASPFGAFDMAGNVAEWVSDWYSDTFYSYSPLVINNPTGPDSGIYRVLRGGSWFSDSTGVSSTARFKAIPNLTSNNLGFRCASPISP